LPISPRSPHESADSVRAYLKEALPNSQLTAANVASGYEPLLLMETSHVMAAFAFSNGDMSKSYKELYGSFKKYYAEQRGRWDALDLSFVFCVRPEIPNLDRFCSNVETDVYFCRKFVVPLAPPLDASLARLPFLPLTPLHGQSMRPPSAQTFLQQCGVTPMLAKFLVVQRERSADGVMEDCLEGRFGEPLDLTPALNVPVAQADRVAAPVRLDAVTIKDFRAYRQAQTFDIGSDVSVLYGPNGFGKTSFFDAIDFAVTGTIGRLKSSGDAHFKKTAKHLDSKAEDSVVSLTFSSNGATRKITRRVSDSKQASLDGRSADRKAILGELTRGDIPATDRVENFVNLFRATHLFSQEHQELAKDFERDCELSEPIVSRLLAFEDYANAVNKSAKVREIAEATIATAEREVKELTEEIADEKRQLDRLRRPAHEHVGGALDEAIESLRRKVRDAGVSVTSDKPDLAVVRGWRASLEARHAEAQARIARMSELAKDAGAMPATLAELTRLRQQLTQKERAFAAADKKRISAEQELQRAQQRLAEITSKRTETQARAALLEWVANTRPRYADIVARQSAISEALSQARTALSQQRESEAKIGDDLRSKERHTNQVAERLVRARADLAVVQSLVDATAAWEANHAAIAAATESAQRSQASLEASRATEQNLLSQLADVGAEETRLSRHIAEVDQTQSDLKKLLSQLQGHVRDGICPLCGEDHGSKGELLDRIQARVAADAASAARVDLSNVQAKSKELSERVAISRETHERENAHLARLSEARTKLIDEIAKFDDAVGKLGLAVDAASHTITVELQRRRDQIQKEVADLARQVQEEQEKGQATQDALSDLRQAIAAAVAELSEKEAALASIQSDASRLRDDPRFAQVSLDIEPDKLTLLQRNNITEISQLNADFASAEAKVTQSKQPVDALREETNSLKTDLPVLRKQVSDLQNTITDITARLEESKLPQDATQDTVVALIAEESRAQAQALELRDLATSLELAIDTATTAAVLTSLRQNIVNKERAITAAKRKAEEHRPWLKYFEAVSGLVSSQQNDAIAQFTREYGPRTSVIQRRLRSVYGFDEVEIHSHQSTIRVRVKRRGEELRPTDYFSQSQQQTLLLGLFLTACLSQTWSAFAPIFLDDPVTHFDDLNTYAFLDLIVGLLESDSGQRQFVISTCDEKFLQLARQKFRHLGQRARFYTFSAIGADGPVVGEIGSQPPDGTESAS
jgi:DNA repair protein SbcC/Rad50